MNHSEELNYFYHDIATTFKEIIHCGVLYGGKATVLTMEYKHLQIMTEILKEVGFNVYTIMRGDIYYINITYDYSGT